MDKIHNWINTGLIVLVGVLVLVGGSLSGSDQLGGATRFPHGYLDTADGYYVDGTAVISGSGYVTTNSFTLGTSGTAITGLKCVSDTAFNPATVASSTPATATTSLTGVALGDFVFATIATSTQGLELYAYASATNVATYILSNPDGDLATVDLATTTLKICYIK